MTDIKEKDVLYVNQNYKQLSKGQTVKILKVKSDTVDVCILNAPELWLKDIPFEVLQIEKDFNENDIN